MDSSSPSFSTRRRFLAVCTAAGLGQTLLPGALFTLSAQAQSTTPQPTESGKSTTSTGLAKITPEMIDAAAVIAGIALSDDQKKQMLEGLAEHRDSLTAIRDLHLPNSVAPAFVFDPVPGGTVLETA